MRRAVVIAAGIVGLVGAPSTAVASHREHSRPRSDQSRLTFTGGCNLSGIVRFQPPLTNAGQSVRDVASASGTCSGTLTDSAGRAQQLNAIPVSYVASDQATNASCGVEAGATGSGALVFPAGDIRFSLAETRLGAVADLTLAGDGGGTAVGTANVSPSVNPLQIAEECAGSGLPEAPVELHLETTPQLSG